MRRLSGKKLKRVKFRIEQLSMSKVGSHFHAAYGLFASSVVSEELSCAAVSIRPSSS